MIGTRSTSTSSSGITAPMNINAVIAHLVDMTPPQRKQFAQLHMDDPMLLSAAKFVDNQISKQAAALSAQRMGAAPPPVNQQVVAQMSPQPPAPQAAPQPQVAPQQQAAPQDQGQAQPMPEDTGIAQLPAPNMEGMAGGGIVGFNEGGLNPKVFGKYLESLGKTPQDFINALPDEQKDIKQRYEAARNAANAGPQRVPVSAAPAQAAAAEQPGMAQRLGQLTRQGLNRVGSFISEGMPKVGIGALAALTAGNENQNTREDEIMAAIHGEGYNGKPYNKKDAEALLKEMKVPGVKLKETAAAPAPAKNDRTKRDPKNYAPAEAAPEKKTGIDQLRQETVAPRKEAQPSEAERPAQDLSIDRFMPAGSKRPSEADVEEANAARMKGAQDALSGFDTDLAKRGKAMTEQEARIAVREATSKDRLDTNTNMSLINAGLSMMQSTGKGLAGIAEGAQVGTKQYQAGLREYDNAKEKLDSARDMIEQYRRTEDTMNDKDRRALTKNINDTRAAGLDSMIGFRTKIYGEDRTDARALLDVTVKQQEAAADRTLRKDLQASSEAGANTRAAISERNAAARAEQLPPEARMLMKLGGGDLKRGMEMQASIAAGKFNPMNAYIQHYLPAVAKDPTAQAKSFEQFKVMLGMDVTRP